MKIAIDLDEVIACFLDAFIKYHNNIHKTTYKKSDFFSYEFWKVIGGTKEEMIDEVYRFHDSSYFDNILPLGEAIEAINKLKENNDLYIITSRQDDFMVKTKKWLDKYLPDTFIAILNSNAYPKKGTRRSKSDLCDENNIDIMIDDVLDYATECMKPGRKIFLFRYPWNTNENIPKGFYVVSGWSEVLKILSK